MSLARTLTDEGITHAFTVPGESFLGLLDALRDGPIRLIATRHEAGAGFMAEAFGQLTGRAAGCLVTRAVGMANLSIALHTARQDSTPLVAIAGQVRRAFRGREAFQEANLVESFGRLCKAAAEVQDAAELDRVTRSLVRVAHDGRPGPVLLSVPEDVFDQAVERSPSPGSTGTDGDTDAARWPSAGDSEIRAVLDVLRTASRPVIVAGAGILRSRGAGPLLVKVAEAMAVPVIASWRRPDVLPNSHRLYLGMAGLGAPKTVRARLEQADVLVAIGTRLSEITTFGYAVPADSTRLVHVDVEPGFSGDRRRPDITVRSDARTFLQAVLAELGTSPASGSSIVQRWDEAARDRTAYLEATRPPAVDHVDQPDGVQPGVVARALRDLLPARTVLTTDAGNFAGWAARYVPLPRDGRFLGPTSGAMGYALPAAIGAALAEPDRPVVALAGDGGFAMLMAELETAVREQVRLVAIVFDNRMYGTIRMHQEQEHPRRAVATDLGPIDFAGVAEAVGARGLRVGSNDRVAAGIGEALGLPGVSVVHVNVDRRYLSVDALLEE